MDVKQDLRQTAWAYAHGISGVVFVIVAWLVARALDVPHPLKQVLFAATLWVAAVGVISTGVRRRRGQDEPAADPQMDLPYILIGGDGASSAADGDS